MNTDCFKMGAPPIALNSITTAARSMPGPSALSVRRPRVAQTLGFRLTGGIWLTGTMGGTKANSPENDTLPASAASMGKDRHLRFPLPGLALVRRGAVRAHRRSVRRTRVHEHCSVPTWLPDIWIPPPRRRLQCVPGCAIWPRRRRYWSRATGRTCYWSYGPSPQTSPSAAAPRL